METSILIDDRISLTPFQPSDRENLIRYLNDAELYRNTLLVPYPYTAAHADEWLARVGKNLEQYGATVNWAIRHREEGVIGGIGTFMKNGWEGHSDEIGYWRAAPFRGKGIMANIIDRYSEYLFATRPALVRLEAWVFAHNPASMKVLEKAGYQREGYARSMYMKNGEYFDAVLFARLRK